jgi:hypothetical protein
MTMEATLALSERMRELQEAMENYSDMTIKNYKFIHALGDAVVEQLPSYLGEGSSVLGVPPTGEYRIDNGDYRDAKFSIYSAGILKLAPIQMGVAVGIPHARDDGRFWPRVVLEFETNRDAINVTVGDGPVAVRGVPLPHTAEDVEKVCEAIHEYIRSVLENPVKVAKAVGKGKLGFI